MGSGDGWELLSQAGRMRNGITAGDRRPTIKLLGWQFMEHTVVTVDGICLELRKEHLWDLYGVRKMPLQRIRI